MHDLTAVACSPHLKQEDLDKFIGNWRRQAEDAIEDQKPERVTFKDDGTPVVPWEQATQIMFAQLAVKKRLEGHG